MNDKRLAVTMTACAALSALLVIAVGTALPNGERRAQAPRMRRVLPGPGTWPLARSPRAARAWLTAP